MKYEYWLSCIRPLAGKKKELIRSSVGSARDVDYIEEKKLREMAFLTEKDRETIRNFQKKGDLETEYDRLLERGIRLVACHDPAYPRRLKRSAGYPYALFVKGRLPDDDRLSVAIVGARQCSAYGERQALRFAEYLAGRGVQIISGMARGIDGAAGRGAINGGGDTYAVLGSGVDVCYPAQNRGLYADITNRGGILSEQLPGTAPRKEHFPARNRIISGLADAVLVMEARERSGSLITADMALEQGRDVYALPGPVDSPLSKGCNRLIRQGAGILLGPEELLEEMVSEPALAALLPGEREGQRECEKSDKNKKVLESAENIVYSCLGLYPRDTSSLLEETGLSPAALMETLVALQIRGYIKEISKGYYIRTS